MSRTVDEDRLTDLLCRHVTEGLGHDETAEFYRLSRELVGFGPDDFDLAAAALDLAFTDEIEEAPAHLRSALSRTGRAWLAGDVADYEPTIPTPAGGGHGAGARLPRLALYSGWLAAAAMLLVTLSLWMSLRESGAASNGAAPGFAITDQVEGAPDVVRVAWQGSEGHELNQGIEGEVVWSPELQRGYMVFRGLAQNDPSTCQYQLWIFDEARDERFPVDGGVFDVTRPCEQIVPIDARLPISRATVFAVTVEPPGGVVVSQRDIVALAALGN